MKPRDRVIGVGETAIYRMVRKYGNLAGKNSSTKDLIILEFIERRYSCEGEEASKGLFYFREKDHI